MAQYKKPINKKTLKKTIHYIYKLIKNITVEVFKDYCKVEIQLPVIMVSNVENIKGVENKVNTYEDTMHFDMDAFERDYYKEYSEVVDNMLIGGCNLLNKNKPNAKKYEIFENC